MSHSADHILALSVMRLANPTTEFQPSSLLDSCAAFSGPQPQQHGDASAGLSREVEGSFINELVSPGSSGAGCDFWLPSRTQALLLPVSAGRLFAGEVFQAYLHIVNKSAAPEGNPNARERERAHNVSVYVEMQVNDSSRYVLLNTASSPELVLLGGRYLDFTVTHLLSEPGNYTMACVITYDTGDEGAQKGHTLRKSFRFSVSSAFSLSHKIREMPVQTNERRKVRVDSALVEVCVENSSGVQVLLCDASLSLPAAGNQNAPPAGTLPAGGSGASSRRAFLVRHEKRDATAERGWSGVHFFKPGEKLRLVFRIEQDEGSGPPLKSLPHLGNVCLEWRSAVGGRGLSSEYLLKAMPLKGNPVEVRVSKCPSVVQAEEPFDVCLSVCNRGKKHIEAVLSAARGGSLGAEREERGEGLLEMEGPENVPLGRIEGGDTLEVNVTLFPTKSGFLSLPPFLVLDFISQRTFEISSREVPQIMVTV